MKPTLVLLALALGPLSPAAAGDADTGAGTPPFPGTRIVADLGTFCPRRAPLAVDANADGVPDFLFPEVETAAPEPVDASDLEELDAPEGTLLEQTIGTIAAAVVESFFEAAPRLGGFRSLAVLDGTSGAALWAYEADSPVAAAALTPDGRTLFAASRGGALYALEVGSGRLLWRRDLDAPALALLASDAGLAVLGPGGVAFRSRSAGEVVWREEVLVARELPGGRSLTGDAKQIYLASTDGSVRALDRATGAVRWTARMDPPASIRLLREGVLLAESGGRLAALAPATGEVRFRFDPRDGRPDHGLVDLGERFVVLRDPPGEPAEAVALDPATGRTVWTLGAAHGVRAVRRDAPGGGPALYLMEERAIRAVRGADGAVLWRASARKTRAIGFAGRTLVALDGRRRIRCFDPVDGRLLWSRRNRSRASGFEAIGGVLLVADGRGKIRTLALDRGTSLGRASLGRGVHLVREADDRLVLCTRSRSWLLAPGPTILSD